MNLIPQIPVRIEYFQCHGRIGICQLPNSANKLRDSDTGALHTQSRYRLSGYSKNK